MNRQHEEGPAVAPATTLPHDAAPAPGQASRSSALEGPVLPRASGLVLRMARDARGVAEGAEDAVAAAARSSGSPLPDAVRRRFEHSLATDLSAVRVHTGATSARAADAVGARAYTVGNDIHFAAGHHDPESAGGRHLLAHEVAHTVQQSGGARGVQYKLEVSSPADRLEEEADRAADAMSAGQPATVSAASGLSREVLQRDTSSGTSSKERPPKEAGDAGAPAASPGPTAASSGAPAASPGPTSTPGPKPRSVGGDVKSKKIVRVAWTVDDGPRAGTPAMLAKLGNRPATLYIQRNRIEGKQRQKKLNKLKAAQTAGSEIAIHGLHKSNDHATWFPTNLAGSYASIGNALRDLQDFKKLLASNGIVVKMVRLPFGLITELSSYLRKLGVSGGTATKRAREIIAGPVQVANKGKPTAEEQAALQVRSDFELYKKSLASSGLHEWGGEGAGTDELSMSQSWQAESAPQAAPGKKQLTDDVTASHGGVVGKKGEFEKRCDRVTATSPEWLVVLSHDSGHPAAQEAGSDVARMESYATQKGVRVEYYTMSDLYQVVRGKAP